MKCMEKEWDSYSVVVEDYNGILSLLRGILGSRTITVDTAFNIMERWLKCVYPDKWHEVYDHFAIGLELDMYEDNGKIKIETVCNNIYIITIEKKAKRKQERACAKCTHHFEGWYIDVGPCQMCRRLQSEEYDLICGGTRFVGPLLECEEERGIKRGVWKRLWRGRDICGKNGRYWVEK